MRYINVYPISEENIRVLCPGCKQPITVLKVHVPTTPSRRRTIEFYGFCRVCPDRNRKPGKYVNLTFVAEPLDEEKSRAVGSRKRRVSNTISPDTDSVRDPHPPLGALGAITHALKS